ncbi:hypothetical protein SOCEGT47_017270 [Sorangium cellulosum]|uniref:Outer membrane protein beta-barrel domain-containing protein n=1 Tax=Sorangium cellulosum TaxID=56 RepID=A0A4P2PWS9_SORCE|nr:hypothetical protein [Sorangium cellulosum]AUX21247.1 hypothetical protein SOCEGT47_017270 [Sorangium cellulosum]
MRKSFARLLPLPTVVVLGSLLLGCPNPNSYQTPRTVEPGKISHSVSLESFGYIGETAAAVDPETGAVTETRTTSGFLPTLPSYQLRAGLTDMLDIGAHVHNLSSMGFDLKVNPVRGVFDLAVDPGAQYFYVTSGESSVHVLYLHAPLMLGVNPTDWFSIVVTPGVTYGLVSGEFSTEDEDSAATADGLLVRGGLGLQFRVSEGFAIHPEITMMKSLEGSGLVYNFGLGFNFGALPSYKDLQEPM